MALVMERKWYKKMKSNPSRIIIIIGLIIVVIAIALIVSSFKKTEEKLSRYIPVNIINSENPDEIVYVDVNDVKKGPKRGHEFSEEFKDATRYVQQTLYEVDGSSFEEWMDDFDRDANPERELEIWVRIANTYEEIKKEYPNDLKIKDDIYRTLLFSSMGRDDFVLDQMGEATLPKKDIKQIIQRWRAQ